MIATDELIKKVRLLLNEPDEDVTLVVLGEDTRRLGDTIRVLLRDAVLFVQHNKTYGVLNPVSSTPDSLELTDNGNGTGSVLLPDDFVTLIEFKVKGWERPCTTMYKSNSPIALAQSNQNTRGGCCKPVCIESVNNEGKPVLVYYSLPEDVSPVISSFVYEALFDEGTGLNTVASNPLVMAVAYQCAGLVYGVFEKHDTANAFMTLALSWCKKE